MTSAAAMLAVSAPTLLEVPQGWPYQKANQSNIRETDLYLLTTKFDMFKKKNER
jgi:hypothetical protein